MILTLVLVPIVHEIVEVAPEITQSQNGQTNEQKEQPTEKVDSRALIGIIVLMVIVIGILIYARKKKSKG